MAKVSSPKENWRNDIVSASTEVINTQTVLPIDSFRNKTPLIFLIRPLENYVLDTKNIALHFDFGVYIEREGAWVGLEPADAVSPLQNFGFSLWQSCSLTVAGVLCENSQEYARAAYLKNILFKSHREQQALESALFYFDNPLHGDIVAQNKGTNRGEYERSRIVKDLQVNKIITPIYLDLLQSYSFFTDKVNCELRLYINDTVNCLQANNADLKLKVEIVSASLHIPRYRLSTPIPKSLTVDYETCRVQNYMCPKDVKTFSKSLNTHQLPRKLIIVLLEEERYFGKLDKSPLIFAPFNVSNITVQANGQIYPELGGLNMDQDDKNYAQPFSSLYNSLHAVSLPFGMTDMDNSFAIYGFNLTPGNQSSRPRKTPIGAVDIDLVFKIPPTNNLVMLIFSYYDAKYHIDNKGIISTSI